MNKSTNLVVSSDLVFRDDVDSRPRTTSLIVAREFGRRHTNVLRDIERLECSQDFGRLNFEPTAYLDEQGREQPMYRITEEGCMRLVMGFTGLRASEAKEAFIGQFKAMQTALVQTQQAHGTIEQILADVMASNARVLADIHSHSALRFDAVDAKVERVECKVDTLAARLDLVAEQNKRRQPIKYSTKKTHLFVADGMCPCCWKQTKVFEFDHFFVNSKPNFEHSWPLCIPCHAELTTGRVARPAVRSAFDAYQERAQRLLPKQGGLF